MPFSKDSYFALDTLKQSPIDINGKEGFSVAENLFGIKTGEYYYTFDGSTNTTQTNEFYTLLNSSTFTQSPVQ